MQKNKYSILVFALFIFIASLFTSCGSVKIDEMRMMEFARNELDSITSIPVLTIKREDILNIDVTGRNVELLTAFKALNPAPANSPAAGEGAAGLYGLQGYRVDEDGKIYLPFIGGVYAVDKTLSQLRQELNNALVQYFDDVSVNVRFLSFKVTITGEVNRPNLYTIPNEKLTVLEAIGMAGDFTSYAERDDVLLIRERGFKREFVRINTQDKNLFKNTYFYLAPGDILYVPPLKAKQYATAGDFFSRYGNFIFPFITVVTFILNLTVTN